MNNAFHKYYPLTRETIYHGFVKIACLNDFQSGDGKSNGYLPGTPEYAVYESYWEKLVTDQISDQLKERKMAINLMLRKQAR